MTKQDPLGLGATGANARSEFWNDLRGAEAPLFHG
jgi:hypothetical protein